MGVLSNLEPKHVWKHFENMCGIPHPSKHEEALAKYVMAEAAKLGYATRRDDVGNLVVEIPATAGHEKAPGVVLQGHLDMVPVAAPGVKHDFLKDPIQPYIDGDYVRAKGTTLGADNGIGGAMMLGVMEDKDVAHGPLELLFTVNEEAGMDGAHGLKADFLKGEMLINLDTEEWGEFYISCAGGGDSIVTLPVQRASTVGTAMMVKIGGLKGGHSGVDINLGRGAGTKILARCLKAGMKAANVQIISIKGGNKRNSIADGAEALVFMKETMTAPFRKAVMNMAEVILGELEKTDPDLEVEINDMDTGASQLEPMTPESSRKVINLLIAMPHGVLAMSPEVPGLVETSANLGVMNSTDTAFSMTLLTRSAVTSQLDAVKVQIKTIAQFVGAEVEEPRGYPGWKPNMESKLLKTAQKVFKGKYGKEAAVKAIHAGLECGLFSAKMPQLDMLSIGPEMHNVHSPAEELHIGSVPKTYDLLGLILTELA